MRYVTKKRERIAISWLVCIAMVFASFAGPFAQLDAQAKVVAPPVTVDKQVVGGEWVDKDLGIAKVKLTVNSQDIETTITTPLITRIVLVLDYSSSMYDNDKIGELKDKAKAFVTQMLNIQGDIQIAVVTFNNSVSSNSFSNDAPTLKNQINNASVNNGTNIQGGIRAGQALLNGVVADNEIMVVLSDGEPNRSYKGTAGGPFTPADTALNYDGATWPTVISAFDYGNVLNRDYNYNLPNSGTDSRYQIGSAWITNHGFGTVSEALLAKKAGTTIYSVGFDISASSNAAKVMKSVASSNSKYFTASSDLTVAFDTIGTSIIEQAAGEGAVVTDPMGFNTDVAGGNNYTFKALIDGSHPVVHTEPAGVTSSVNYDGTTDTFDWVLTTGDIKEGTYTLEYYVQIQDINGNGVGDNVGDVLTNHQAVLEYTDAAGTPQSVPFADPTLKVEHYTVEYYFNGTIDDSLTTIQAAIAGRTPVTMVAPAFSGFDFEKMIYGNDVANTALDIVQDGANNVIKIYYVEKTGSLEVTKKVLKDNVPFDVTDTFYFGLFSGADGTGLIGSVKQIGLDEENTGSVEFTGLTLGTPYYVFETDSSGVPIADTVGGQIHLGDYILDGQGDSFTPTERDLSGEIVIKNQLAVGTSVQFEGTKNLTGRLLGANDVFHFAIFEGDSTTPIGSGQTSAVTGNPDSINIDFDQISYGIGDVGTHTYTVKEIPPIDELLNGVTFDTLPRTVTVVVSIDAQGILSAIVTYPERGEELVFNNEYQAEPTSWAPEATKSLTGKELADGMFDFTITEVDGAAPIQTVTNDGTAIPFDAIKYDEPGTYEYVIAEVIPADADSDGVLDGIKYDQHSLSVTVTVTDNGIGELEAVAVYEGDQEFKNEYTTEPVTWTPDITKELIGMDLEDEMFQFTITEMPQARTIMELYSETVWNDGSDIPFSGIVFDEPGVYRFEIFEIAGTMPGMTYDDKVINVEVTVTDNGDGTMSAESSYQEGQTFTNTYEGPGTITVNKDVVVLTDDPEITVNYTFYAALFEDQDGKMVLASEVKELQVVDSATATATFDKLDLGRTYYVFETDADGNIIETAEDGTIISPIIPDWTNIFYDNAVISMTSNNMYGEAAITNVFDPEDFPLFGSVTVNKTVTVNDKAFASNRTFYAALFADKELTKMVSDVKALKMNGNSKTSIEFLEDMDGNPLEAGATYYVAETDKNGVPLTGSYEDLGFEIDIDNAQVVITEEGTEVNIINKFKSEEFPITGDDSNMNLWLFLGMLSVAGALVPFAFRKKEVTND